MYGLFNYLHEWLIYMANVGKYTSPMDGMGVIQKHDMFASDLFGASGVECFSSQI